MNQKIYIIIVNFNNWLDTIECLESVLRNDYPDYQIIVVDNNSQNNSMEYIKAWAEGKLNIWIEPDNSLKYLTFPPVAKPIPYIYYTRQDVEKGVISELEKKNDIINIQNITTKYPIVFIQTGYNGGFAFSNNLGIKYALEKRDFSYVLLLNNDTVVKKDFLSELVKASINKNVGITGCKIYLYHDPQKIWFNGGKFKKLTGRVIHTTKIIDHDISYCNFITGACMLIKSIIIEKVGLLEECFFMYMEDMDYCFRVKNNGYQLNVAHNAVIFHKEGASLKYGKNKKFLWKESQRSDIQKFLITGYLNLRNDLYFVKSNFSKFYTLFFILCKTFPILIRRVLGIIIFDENKIERINILVRGINDALFNKMGKPEGLN